jgi:hypothetical protein
MADCQVTALRAYTINNYLQLFGLGTLTLVPNSPVI